MSVNQNENYLSDDPEWVEQITRFEKGQRLVGGIDGSLNKALRQLAKRTRWLKENMGQGNGSVSSVGGVLPDESGNIPADELAQALSEFLSGGGKIVYWDMTTSITPGTARPVNEWDGAPTPGGTLPSATILPDGKTTRVAVPVGGLGMGAAFLGGPLPATGKYFVVVRPLLSANTALEQSANTVAMPISPDFSDQAPILRSTYAGADEGLLIAGNVADPACVGDQPVVVLVDCDSDFAMSVATQQNIFPVRNIAQDWRFVLQNYGNGIGAPAAYTVDSVLTTNPTDAPGVAIPEGYMPWPEVGPVELPECGPGDLLVVRPVSGTFQGKQYVANRDAALVIDPATQFIIPLIQETVIPALGSNSIANESLTVSGETVTQALETVQATAEAAVSNANDLGAQVFTLSQGVAGAQAQAQDALQNAGAAHLLASDAEIAAAEAQQQAALAYKVSVIQNGYSGGGGAAFSALKPWTEIRLTHTGAATVDLSQIPEGIPVLLFRQGVGAVTLTAGAGPSEVARLCNYDEGILYMAGGSYPMVLRLQPSQVRELSGSSLAGLVDDLVSGQLAYRIAAYNGVPGEGSITGLLEVFGYGHAPAAVLVQRVFQRLTAEDGRVFWRYHNHFSNQWSAWVVVSRPPT